MNKDIERILKYLNEKRGFDFSGYRPSMLERRISKRVAKVKSENFDQYLSRLKEDPDEPGHLLDVLTINVSRFFRGTLAFECIAEKILPALVSEKMRIHDHSLRVWSAGCSTGEEPYSIAILINDLLQKEGLKTLTTTIFATDIDEGAMSKAKEAVYSFESITDVKYRFMKKYFTKDGQSYRLSDEVKELVFFSLYDMLDRRTYVPPESVFGNFDMVLCRNMLIYLQAEYQDIIFEKLYRSLDKDGYLVLGEAEVPNLRYKKHLRRINEYFHIYQKS